MKDQHPFVLYVSDESHHVKKNNNKRLWLVGGIAFLAIVALSSMHSEQTERPAASVDTSVNEFFSTSDLQSFPELFEVASHTTSLSTKGSLCSMKDVVLTKMGTLLSKILNLQAQALARIEYRQTEAEKAKQEWLDAEGQRAVLKKTAVNDDTNYNHDLKVVTDLQNEVNLDKLHVDHVQANNTAETAEILAEQAAIRSVIADIRELSSDSTPAAAAAVGRKPALLRSIRQRVTRLLDQPAVARRDPLMGGLLQAVWTTKLPAYQESDDVVAIFESMLTDFDARLRALQQALDAAKLELSQDSAKLEAAEGKMVEVKTADDTAKQTILESPSTDLKAKYVSAQESLADSVNKNRDLNASYTRQIVIIQGVIQRVATYCKDYQVVGGSSVGGPPMKPGTYGSGQACPVNYYCPATPANPSPVACPRNTASVAGSADVYDCKALTGYFGKSGSAATLCPAGSYCEAGTELPAACPPGTTSSARSSSLLDCASAAGYYGPPGQPGTLCPQDAYCPLAATSPRACPTSYIANIGSAHLSDCRPGPALPPQSEITCAAGSYCPTPGAAQACPTGTTSLPGATKASDCVSAAGYFEPQAGGPSFRCPANFYCPPDMPESIPCPANTLSPPGSASPADCAAAPGTFGGAGAAAAPCRAGYYCPGGAGGPLRACPPGSSSPPGSSALESCSVLAGFFGRVTGTVSACPPNTDSPAGSVSASACRALPGFFTDNGATQLCPSDAYCPGGGSLYNCPAGSSTAGAAGRPSPDDCVPAAA